MWILVLLGLVVAGVVIAVRQSGAAFAPPADDMSPADDVTPAPSDGGAQLAGRRFTPYELGVLSAAAGRSAYEGSHYSPEFILYFSQGGPGYPGYARVGVLNDPTNLNANHVRNLTNAYAAVVTGSVVV